MATDPNATKENREKRISAFNRRKNNSKKSKQKNRNRKKSKNELRIKRNDSKNYGFNNNISETEEKQIFNSLLKAVANNNKLAHSELQNVFQNALSKLNAAWFRQNLASFFKNKESENCIGDIIIFVLRLFVINFDLNATKHNVPFRYLLLDLIAPSLHKGRHCGHKSAPLLQPTPKMTDYHRSHALKIFTLWILETTKNVQMRTRKENNNDNNDDNNNNNNDFTLDSLNEFPQQTLLFIPAKEMQCLFRAFSLNELLSQDLRLKICDKIYDLLQNDNNAPAAVSWSIYFKLMDEIPYNSLLLPLLRDQTLLHCAIHYVDCISRTKTKHIEKVKRFIAVSIAQLMHNNETNITASRAHKLLSVWKFDPKQKEFEPISICQMKNFLKWTIYKGHIDDYAALVCSHSIALQLFVVKQCHNHASTYESCVRWAKCWDLEQNDACKSLVQHAKQWLLKNKYKENHKKESFISGFDDIEGCDIKESQIVFVDDMKTLKQAQKVLMDEKVDCIGLDLEFMSVELYLPSVPQNCQILQIATADVAFIFDLECMKEQLYDAFDDLLSEIFSESAAVKIGMGFEGDLRHLRKQYPNAIAFKSPCDPYLDLAVISKFMKGDAEFRQKTSEFNINIKMFDDTKENKIRRRFKKSKDKEGGLAKIVRYVLDKKLNKFEQLSNWSNRPLRVSQLKYAALDSMVECWIYRKLKEWQTKTILPDLKGFCEMLYAQAN